MPPLPSDAAEAANRSALADHEAARYAEAALGFEAALAAEPTYAGARYNLACAYARLGRLDDARRLMTALLCEDLPSYAPHLASDADLEPVRAALTPLVPTIAAQYLAAAEGGAAMVSGRTHVLDVRADWTWTQAGVWVHAARRFIPMGPRVRERASEPGVPMVAARYDAERGRVVVVSLRGNDAEDALRLADVSIGVYVAPTGAVELDAQPSLGEVYGLDVALADAGVLVERDTGGQSAGGALRIGADGAEPTDDRIAGSHLVIGTLAWHPEASVLGYEATRSLLRTPTGEHPLGPTRIPTGTRRIRVGGGEAFVSVNRSGDCGLADRYEIQRVDLADGTATMFEAGVGQPYLEIGGDGALYLQIGGTTRRWPSPSSAHDASEPLPEGVGLTSQGDDYNPYC